jgi:hypothetical protein
MKLKYGYLIALLISDIICGNALASEKRSTSSDLFEKTAGEYMGVCLVISRVLEKHCNSRAENSSENCINKPAQYLTSESEKQRFKESMSNVVRIMEPSINSGVLNAYENGIKMHNGNLESFCNNIRSQGAALIRNAEENVKSTARLLQTREINQSSTSSNRIKIHRDVSIDVPSNWTRLSGVAKEELEARVDTFTNNNTSGSLNFAANLYDGNNKTLALLNARFYPENKFTQDDAKRLSPAHLKIFDDEVKKVQESVGKSMNTRLLFREPTKVIIINGIYVLKQEHVEEGAPNFEKIRVERYRVWNAPNSFTLTLTVKVSEEEKLRKGLDGIVNSLTISK